MSIRGVKSYTRTKLADNIRDNHFSVGNCGMLSNKPRSLAEEADPGAKWLHLKKKKKKAT